MFLENESQDDEDGKPGTEDIEDGGGDDDGGGEVEDDGGDDGGGGDMEDDVTWMSEMSNSSCGSGSAVVETSYSPSRTWPDQTHVDMVMMKVTKMIMMMWRRMLMNYLEDLLDARDKG